FCPKERSESDNLFLDHMHREDENAEDVQTADHLRPMEELLRVPTEGLDSWDNMSQQAATRNKGKEIVNSSTPTYDQEPAMVVDDDEMSKENDIDKLMALISLSFKKIYKPTNNNLRTSSNTSRANQDNTPRINRGTGYDNQRAVNVARTRENVEVTPDAADNYGPIFNAKPLQKTDQYDDDDLARERDFLASLIEKLKCEINDRVISITIVSRPQIKSNQLEDRVMHNNSQGKKQQVDDHSRNFKFFNNKTSVTACNDSLNAKTSNVNFVCVTCGKCSRGIDIYSITLQDTSTPNPICLIAKASSSQAWLWHRRLSHLNFDTINLLLKYDIVTSLPILKFIKDHLCSSYELGKAKRGDDVAIIKRQRQDLHCDDVRDLVTASRCGRFKDDLVSSTWRWRHNFKATSLHRFHYIYKTDFMVLGV
nr:ribonuclease H-like domain-containing protein [Tanacetum cinerariifolium]